MSLSPYRKLLLFCLVLLAIGRFPSTGEPLTQDQAVFTLGGKLLLQGERLYRDVFDHKPPLMYFIYAPLYMFFGPAGFGPAIFDLLLHLIQCVLLYYLLARLLGERSAAYSVIIFVYLLLCPIWSRGIRLLQAEVIANVLLLLMARLCVDGKVSKLSAWLLGFCSSLLFATKFLPLLFALSPIMLLESEELKSKKLWLWGSLGFICGLSPWIIYLSSYGLWTDFVAAVFHFNRCYAGEITNPLWPAISAKAWALWLPALLAIYGLSVGRAKSSGNAGSVGSYRAATTWLITSLVVLFMQRKFFYYHFIVLLIPLSWLGAIGLQALTIKLFDKGEERKWLSKLALLIVFLQLGLFLARYTSFHKTYYYLRLWNNDFPGFAEQRQVTTNRTLLETILLAASIKQYSQPDEELLVWGMNPLLYLLADRKPAMKFILHNWLVLDRPPFDKWGDAKARRLKFLTKMRENPPACFVVATGDKSVLSQEDSYKQLTSDSEIYGILKNSYTLRLRIRNSYLWVHKSKLVRATQKVRPKGQQFRGVFRNNSAKQVP